MTERKPHNVDWQTWIDRQIEEGQALGAFDGLAGHGKPLAGIDTPRDELWWVRDKLRREGVDHLPPSLAILRQADEARAKALAAPSEHEARRIIEEINAEIRQLNRLSIQGPPTTLMPFDVDELLESWRQRTPAREQVEPPPGPTGPVAAARHRRTLRTILRERLGRSGAQ